MIAKGIVLAGGSGTRLWPMTQTISKQLLCVYDKPMVYYPISTLMLSGIREILVITTPSDLEMYRSLLADGRQWGIEIVYAIQDAPNGLAEALVIAEKYLDGSPSVLVLGDNLIYGPGLGRNLSNFITDDGAAITAYEVADPSTLGVVVFDGNGNPQDLIEKPPTFRSKWAIPGLYFYDASAPERARKLKPSKRNELEITDLNLEYLNNQKLTVHKLPRGTAWLDLGTEDGLLEAGQFVKLIQDRQGQLIGSPEEIAFISGWIDPEQILKNLDNKKSNYAVKLKSRILGNN